MLGEHAGVVMPVTPPPGHQRGEPVEQLERGEGELGLAGGQRLGEAIADGLIGWRQASTTSATSRAAASTTCRCGPSTW
jgi:hypothetical protein